MTRGREDKVAHLVAENLERYAPHRPLQAALADLRAAWTRQQDLRSALDRAKSRHHFMAKADYGEPAHVAEFQAVVDEIRDLLTTATNQVRVLHEPAIRSLPPGRVKQEHGAWLQQRRHEQQAAQAGWETVNHPRPGPGRPPYGYPSTSDRGRGISR